MLHFEQQTTRNQIMISYKSDDKPKNTNYSSENLRAKSAKHNRDNINPENKIRQLYKENWV